MAQSCLEIVSMNERHEEIVRSDYNRNNQYSSLHPDAIANGDSQGKGTRHGGHTHWLPNCRSYMGVSTFVFNDFDTAVSSHAGNNVDNDARNVSLARSLYNDVNRYSALLINTSANIREGQYFVP